MDPEPAVRARAQIAMDQIHAHSTQ
jgi:hypothetical protein